MVIFFIIYYGRIFGYFDREKFMVYVMKDGRIVKIGFGEFVD